MIRKLLSKDKKQLEVLINKIDIFSQDEKSVAMELIEESLIGSMDQYYNVFVYEEDDKILGYHCTGQRALTDGVYDLYWIVVDPGEQKKGIGQKLLKHAEDFVIERKGRWILAETSSRESYTPTRNFYFRNKYSIVAEIKDFYSVNDSLIVFGKYIIT